MMRMLLYTLLFFFGPALLMFALRHAFVLLRLWWRMRRLRARRQDAEVIDITPEERRQHLRPGTLFITASMLIASLCAWLAWQDLQMHPPPGKTRYVPAHLDAYGNLVPGTILQEPAH